MSDYLYDKEGEDEAAQKLERSLSGLKYVGKAPALPTASPRERGPDYSKAPIDAYRPRAGWLGGRMRLGIAAGVALVGGICATLALKPQGEEGGALVPVVVAATDLNPGTVVTFDMLSLRVLPEKFVEPRALRPEAVVKVLGHPVHALVREGDPLLSGQFDPAPLKAQAQQKTAVALSVAEGQGAAVTAIHPDDHVDLVGTFTDPASHASVAVTLLKNVSVGQAPAGEPNGVSLLVFPEEAQILRLGSQLKGLSLNLRHQSDTISITPTAGESKK